MYIMLKKYKVFLVTFLVVILSMLGVYLNTEMSRSPKYLLLPEELGKLQLGEAIVKIYPENPRLHIEMRKDDGRPLSQTDTKYTNYFKDEYYDNGNKIVIQVKETYK